MPLPLFIPIAIAAAGAFGIGKTVKSVVDNKKANEIGTDAEWRVRKANERLEEARARANEELESLGAKKIQTMSTTMKKFVELYERIGPIGLEDSAEAQRLRDGDYTSNLSISDLKIECDLMVSAAGGLGAGVLGGGLAAMGAYGGTMALASAGTGTAISALSGVAATNATLAWLGGGTLAAGGLGMAGGAMVLGTLVAGPALLIFGSVLGSKASANLDRARAAREQAETHESMVETSCQKLDQIYEVVGLAKDVLTKLRDSLRRATNILEDQVEEFGLEQARQSDDVRRQLAKTVKYAQLVKAVVDTPILSEEGALLPLAASSFSRMRAEEAAVS